MSRNHYLGGRPEGAGRHSYRSVRKAGQGNPSGHRGVRKSMANLDTIESHTKTPIWLKRRRRVKANKRARASRKANR